MMTTWQRLQHVMFVNICYSFQRAVVVDGWLTGGESRSIYGAFG